MERRPDDAEEPVRPDRPNQEVVRPADNEPEPAEQPEPEQPEAEPDK